MVQRAKETVASAAATASEKAGGMLQVGCSLGPAGPCFTATRSCSCFASKRCQGLVKMRFAQP